MGSHHADHKAVTAPGRGTWGFAAACCLGQTCRRQALCVPRGVILIRKASSEELWSRAVWQSCKHAGSAADLTLWPVTPTEPESQSTIGQARWLLAFTQAASRCPWIVLHWSENSKFPS